MILDRLENAATYRTLGVRVAAALAYLKKTDFASMADGRYELDGNRLVAIVQRYRTRPLAKIVWEAHRRFVDVQYIAQGHERMGYTPVVEGLKVTQPYDADKDAALFEAQGDLFEVPAGSFTIFFPQDAHAPGLVGGSPPVVRDVLKVVVKCQVDD